MMLHTRPTGKIAILVTQALPSFMMGIPPQAMPLRPSQRDAAQEAQGQAAGQAADVAAKGATLRQSYNFLADPEKQPKLASKPSPGTAAACIKLQWSEIEYENTDKCSPLHSRLDIKFGMHVTNFLLYQSLDTELRGPVSHS